MAVWMCVWWDINGWPLLVGFCPCGKNGIVLRCLRVFVFNAKRSDSLLHTQEEKLPFCVWVGAVVLLLYER